MVRRGYGYGLFLLRQYRQQLVDLVKNDPFNSLTARVASLGLKAIDAFEESGFLSFDSQAVAEVVGKYTVVILI